MCDCKVVEQVVDKDEASCVSSHILCTSQIKLKIASTTTKANWVCNSIERPRGRRGERSQAIMTRVLRISPLSLSNIISSPPSRESIFHIRKHNRSYKRNLRSTDLDQRQRHGVFRGGQRKILIPRSTTWGRDYAVIIGSRRRQRRSAGIDLSMYEG